MNMLDKLKGKLSNIKFGHKKGNIGVNQIAPFAMSFGIGVVILAIMAAVTGGVRDGFTAASAEYNITDNGLTGLLNFSAEFDLIGTIMGYMILLGIVAVGLFYLGTRAGGGR